MHAPTSTTALFSPPALDRAAVDEPPALKTAAFPAASLAGVDPPRIMIVDDEPVVVRTVRKFLTQAGYADFVTATDSTTVIETLRRGTPDLILLDIVMPEVGGLELLRMIRAEFDDRCLPVIILTAADDPFTRRIALELGASDFLSKPVDSAELRLRVRNALTLKTHHDHLQELVRHRTRELARANEELQREVAERWVAEQKARRQSAILQGANRIFEGALTCANEREVAQTFLSVAEGLTQSQFGWVAELNALGRLDALIVSDAGWQACRVPRGDAVRLLRNFEVKSYWGRAFREGAPIIVNNPASHPDRTGLPEGHPPIHSFLGVSLKQGGKTFGMVALANKPGGYTPGDQQVVEDLAGAFVEALMRKRAEENLRVAREDALAANRTKSQFLANMSHEIRTPLTAIIGFTDLLFDEANSPAAMQAVQTVKRNCRHLLKVVNDILDLSKIESGRPQPEWSQCPLAPIVAEVVDLLRVSAAEKKLSLAVRHDGPVPETIRTDPTRLREILLNLVGNAVKFTFQGSVTLSVGLDPGRGGPRLRFEVADTGIGMTDEQVAMLFKPFVQADGSSTRKFGGTGLGLAISRRLARLLGGDITVRSVAGRGSTFTLAIPPGPLDGIRLVAGEPGLPMQAPAEPPIAPPAVAGPLAARVLLVEDSIDNQRLIQMILAKAGAEVAIVENGEQAVERLLGGRSQADPAEPRPFDVVLMDMQMPVMDGYEATRRLRAAGYGGPIVALTAHAMKLDAEQCLAAGCDGYMSKPLDRQGLVELVREHAATSAKR